MKLKAQTASAKLTCMKTSETFTATMVQKCTPFFFASISHRSGLIRFDRKVHSGNIVVSKINLEWESSVSFGYQKGLIRFDRKLHSGNLVVSKIHFEWGSVIPAGLFRLQPCFITVQLTNLLRSSFGCSYSSSPMDAGKRKDFAGIWAQILRH